MTQALTHSCVDPSAPQMAPVVGQGGAHAGMELARRYIDQLSTYGRVAPPPVNDRYPIVIGQGLNLTYVANAKRNALTGYRQGLVDLLTESMEEDPHAFCVVAQRVLAVSGAEYDVIPAELQPDDPEREEAAQIAAEFAAEWRNIPFRSQAIAGLVWGDYYGISADELDWDPRPGDRWAIVGMRFVHNRRLAFPDLYSWDVYVWDQGAVGAPFFQYKTGSFPGLRIADYPLKFVVHQPQLRAEYPTRDGIGRIMLTYMAIKRMVVRGTAADLERNNRPQVVATFTTTDDGNPRGADDKDIEIAKQAAAGFGAGTMSSITIPDSVKLNLMKAANGMTAPEFLAYLDAALSKCAQGQTFTTEPGKFGSKGTSEQGKEQLGEICRYSANGVCDSLNSTLGVAWMKLNHPDKMHLQPKVRAKVVSIPDLDEVMQRIERGAKVGMPIDADKAGEMTGLPLTPREEGEIRRLGPASQTGLEMLSSVTAEKAKQERLAREKAQAEALAQKNAQANGGQDPNEANENTGGAEDSDESEAEQDTPKGAAKKRPPKQMSDLVRHRAQVCLTDGSAHDGVIVALRIPVEVAHEIALVGGEAPSELHITVAFLGRIGEMEAATFPALREQLGALVSRWQGPLYAKLGGIGRFSADDGDAFYLSVDCPLLHRLRAELDQVLERIGCPAKSHHGLSPHVTLAYLPAEAPNPLERCTPRELAFDGLELWAGPARERFVFPREGV